MLNQISQLELHLIDACALSWFVLCWAGYRFYAHSNAHRRDSLLAAMNMWREAWAMAILERDNRIMDSQVINGLVRKETFFASTTILILASAVALMGAGDEVNKLTAQIPYAQQISLALWELKVIVLALIFVYAFFKFSWSIRQHSYSAIILASIPMPNAGDRNEAHDRAIRLSQLSSLGARHFNDGIRAYYFALAELSWFIHPALFMLSTAWVVIVLYRREFHSRALTILTPPTNQQNPPTQ